MLSEFWKGVLQEVLAGVVVAAFAAFVAWLRMSYKKFRSMEGSLARIAEGFPPLVQKVEDHGQRLTSLAGDVASLKLATPTRVTSPANGRRQRP